MSIFQHIPAIIRVIMVFILVLICIRKRLYLGHAFLLGAASLSILFGLKPQAVVGSMAASIIDSKTLSIAIIVSLILILSNSMELVGALIGLLPMPGGAIFSAPMVKKLGMRSSLSRDQLSFINYWFRHIWEYWWPLYPGVLLTAILADISLLTIMLCMCPLTIIAVGLGYGILKNPGQLQQPNESSEPSSVWPFMKELVPIVIVIIPGLGIGLVLSLAFPSLPNAKEAGLILALCIAIGWVWSENGISKGRIWLTLRDPWLLKMGYMIVSILIFKGILEDSTAVEAISHELMVLHVPLWLIAAALPFLVGLSSGVVIAFVGTTLPILIPLIYALGEAHLIPAYVMLVLACGYTGVLLSPLHLCLLISSEYFSAPMGSLYRHLWLPCLSLIGSSILYFWILQWIYGRI
jgi:integral membrane protein (TIGR00529 family)